MDTELEGEANCAVCLSSIADVTLQPCKHQSLCSCCACKLVEQSCPLCRQVITSYYTPFCKSNLDIRELRNTKKIFDSSAISNTPQIVFIGYQNANQNSLVEKLTEKFSFQEPYEPQELFMRSTYDANFRINGITARLVEVPDILNISIVEGIEELLLEIFTWKLSFFVICVSQDCVASVEELRIWFVNVYNLAIFNDNQGICVITPGCNFSHHDNNKVEQIVSALNACNQMIDGNIKLHIMLPENKLDSSSEGVLCLGEQIKCLIEYIYDHGGRNKGRG